MKKLLVLVPLLLLLCSSVVLAAPNDGLQKADAATVLVRTPIGGGAVASGTGVCVGSEDGHSLVLTNSHVASSFKADVIWRKNGNHQDPYWTTGDVLGRSGQAGIYPDLALILLDQTVPSVDLADEVPDVSGKVMSFGYGPRYEGWKPVHRQGVVISDHFADPWLTSSLLQVEGDSGCGVFNPQGQLVGCNSLRGNNYEHAMGANVATIRVFVTSTLAQKRPHLFQKLRARLAKLSVRLFPRLAAKMGVKAQAPSAAPPKADKAAPAPKKVEPQKPEPKKVGAAPNANGCPCYGCGCKLKQPKGGGAGCTCYGTCPCKDCPDRKPAAAPKAGPLTFSQAHAKAVKENKPLVVFVDCPNVRAVPGAVVTKGPMTVPVPPGTGIVVCKPDGKGQLVIYQFLKGCASDAVLASVVGSCSR